MIFRKSFCDEEHLAQHCLILLWVSYKDLDRLIRYPGTELTARSSNPFSSKYGQHYTAEEVHEIFAPSSYTVDRVRAWLEAAGIEPHRVFQSTNKQWLQFDAETAEVEGLLQAEYHHYEHLHTGRTNIGCDE